MIKIDKKLMGRWVDGCKEKCLKEGGVKAISIF
jgi:hypothetical protein